MRGVFSEQTMTIVEGSFRGAKPEIAHRSCARNRSPSLVHPAARCAPGRARRRHDHHTSAKVQGHKWQIYIASMRLGGQPDGFFARVAHDSFYVVAGRANVVIRARDRAFAAHAPRPPSLLPLPPV